jgi:hypothetical protein
MTHEDIAGSGFFAGVVAGYVISEALLYLVNKHVVALVLSTLAAERAKIEEAQIQMIAKELRDAAEAR